MTVTGIGGLFFRAKDPEALVAWYKDHLDMEIGHGPWRQEAGVTVLAPFKQATDYWPADRQWMLNLRITDMDALTARLTAKGVAVQTDPSWDTPEIGRFARIHDPEGNPIELWEPSATVS